MKKVLLLIVLILPVVLSAQIPVLDWVLKQGSTGNDQSAFLRSRNDGSVIVYGVFANTVDFDPGSGILNKTSFGQKEAYIQNLDTNGNLIWVTTVGGVNSASIIDIVETPSGDLICTGQHWGSLIIDTGLSNLVVPSNGLLDMFILRLGSDGSFKWVKTLGTASYDYIGNLDIDEQINIYVTGRLRSTMDMDPGAGVYNLTSNGNDDIFLLRLDSNGNFYSANQIGGLMGEFPGRIEYCDNGNLMLCGSFSGTVDFDPSLNTTIKTAIDGVDGFILKMDTSFNLQWAKTMGNYDMINANRFRRDINKNIYVYGRLHDSLVYNNGISTTALYGNGFQDGYVLKLDSTGNYIWGKVFGGTDSDIVYDVLVQGDRLIVVGDFYQTMDLDPGPNVVNTISNGQTDIFLSYLDTSGQFIYGFSQGGSGWDIGYSLLGLSNKSFMLSGAFEQTVDFDPGTSVNNITSAGILDIFVQKFEIAIPLPIELLDFTASSMQKKGLLKWQTAQEENNSHFKIQRSDDGTNFETIGVVRSKAKNGNAIYKMDYEFIDVNPLYGANYYRLEQVDIDGKISFSDIKRIDFFDTQELSIWPSPAKNILHLNLENAQVSIYDLTGKLLIQSKQQEINVASLAKGIYILKATKDGLNYQSKFVKE